jgi:hypothetical protein
MRRYLSIYSPVIFVAITGLSCSAGTVVSVSGTSTGGLELGIFFVGGPLEQAYAAVEFTTTTPIVDGAAYVDFVFSSGMPVTAWLTNAVGPGTTVDNVIATNIFGGSDGPEVAISGIDIDPGTYFLVMEAAFENGGSNWAALLSPTVSGSGTYDGSFAGSSSTNFSFAPSNTFNELGDALEFEIDSGVPEPAAAGLVSIGLVGLALGRRLKRLDTVQARNLR